MVEGFAEFVFLELLFVVGRGHCEADFGYAVLEEFELVGGYPKLGDGADVCVGKDDVVHYYLVIASSLALQMTVPLSSMSSSEKVRIFIIGPLRKTIQLDLTVATME